MTITAKVHNHTITLPAELDIAEGARVRVLLDDDRATDEDFRSDGRPWPKTPEEIEAFVAEMDATPGLDVSNEEYARMEAERLARKAQGIAETKERMARVAALFP